VTQGASSSAESPGTPGSKKKPSSGLPYCPQPTPEWQKGIGHFFTITPKEKKEASDEEVTKSAETEDKENTQETNNDSPKPAKKSKGKGKAKKPKDPSPELKRKKNNVIDSDSD